MSKFKIGDKVKILDEAFNVYLKSFSYIKNKVGIIIKKELFNTINGSEIGDGDATDVEGKLVSSITNKPSQEDVLYNRMVQLISDCETEEALDTLQKANPDVDIELFNDQRAVILFKK